MQRIEQAAARDGFQGGFQMASKMFSSKWSGLSKEERAPFKKLEREAKKDNYNLNNKFTVTGMSLAQVRENELKQQKAEQQDESFIKSLATGPGAETRNYIFMKALYSVEEIRDATTKVFWPLEMAMVSFNLKDGVRSTFGTLIDTQEVPVGYASAAMENTDVASLPMPGDEIFLDESKDYKELLRKIFGFTSHWLKDGYDLPGHHNVVFCYDAEMGPITTGIQWMVDKLDGEDNEKYQDLLDNLKLFKISKLVLAFADEANRLNPTYKNYIVDYKLDLAAEAVINKRIYDFKEDIACSYHQSELAIAKSEYCAQSIVTRRAYLLLDEFVPAYKYQVTNRQQVTVRDFTTKLQVDAKKIAILSASTLVLFYSSLNDRITSSTIFYMKPNEM